MTRHGFLPLCPECGPPCVSNRDGGRLDAYDLMVSDLNFGLTALTRALALLAGMGALAAAPSSGFVGSIEPAPVPGPTTVIAIMPRASSDHRADVAAFVPPNAAVYMGVVPAFGEYRPRFLLAEFADGSYALFADFNADGKIQAHERLSFAAGDRASQTAYFVVPGWRYASYPVTFADPKPLVSRSPPVSPLPPSRTVTMSNTVAVRGQVRVGGRDVAFCLGLDLTTGAPSAMVGRQYMDTDANGKFDTDYRSPENARARGAAPMFRVGGAYLSVDSIDVPAARVRFSSHSAREYERFELRVGEVLPDFVFTEFSGHPRRLRDYRGQFVLLDFWGTWCGPCVAEMPFLRRAYGTFHSKGFEIIGMNSEHSTSSETLAAGLERARAFGEENGLTWPEAREESIRSLIDRRFMIETWPTMILLDRDGRIVSVNRTDIGQPGLRGGALATTLTTLMRPISNQLSR